MKKITPIDQIVHHIREAIFAGKFIPGLNKKIIAKLEAASFRQTP